MAGYTATSSTELALAIGQQNLQTQSALGYVIGDSIQLTYFQNQSIYMTGLVTNYNPVTGAMTVNVLFVQTGGLQLQPVWNTQPWGSGGGLLNDWNLTLIGGVATSAAVVPVLISVRNLGTSWDPQYGNGTSNFLTNNYAVAQIISQKLKLWQGEWFENTALGTPWLQQILGQSVTNGVVALILREQILSVPYVNEINSFSVSYAGASRSFSFTANVSTAFGTVTVTNGNASAN